GSEPGYNEQIHPPAISSRRVQADRDGHLSSSSCSLMVEPRASHFWQTAVRSGLIDTRQLKACWDAIPPPRRTLEAIDRRLARHAVQAGHLTAWQAQQILGGRSTGFLIHKYRLLDVLGHGGMGQVFLAWDTCLSRKVALKLVSVPSMSNPTAVARF